MMIPEEVKKMSPDEFQNYCQGIVEKCRMAIRKSDRDANQGVL